MPPTDAIHPPDILPSYANREGDSIRVRFVDRITFGALFGFPLLLFALMILVLLTAKRPFSEDVRIVLALTTSLNLALIAGFVLLFRHLKSREITVSPRELIERKNDRIIRQIAWDDVAQIVMLGGTDAAEFIGHSGEILDRMAVRVGGGDTVFILTLVPSHIPILRRTRYGSKRPRWLSICLGTVGLVGAVAALSYAIANLSNPEPPPGLALSFILGFFLFLPVGLLCTFDAVVWPRRREGVHIQPLTHNQPSLERALYLGPPFESAVYEQPAEPNSDLKPTKQMAKGMFWVCGCIGALAAGVLLLQLSYPGSDRTPSDIVGSAVLSFLCMLALGSFGLIGSRFEDPAARQVKPPLLLTPEGLFLQIDGQPVAPESFRTPAFYSAPVLILKHKGQNYTYQPRRCLKVEKLY
jgi:hypothetical protein